MIPKPKLRNNSTETIKKLPSSKQIIQAIQRIKTISLKSYSQYKRSSLTSAKTIKTEPKQQNQELDEAFHNFKFSRKNLFKFSATKRQIVSAKSTYAIPRLIHETNISERLIEQNNYDDDEVIIPSKKLNNSTKMYNLEENLTFEIQAMYKLKKLSDQTTQQLPAIISIKTKDDKNECKSNRLGVDLICLIDKSGSMQGEKLQTVKQSLKILLEFLIDQDRLQLITFDGQALRLSPLKCTTKTNKQYFTQLIEQIYSNGGTNISSATEIAFEQIKRRKYRNNVTSIFLLSDGQDENAKISITKQLQRINEEFTIFTFGFGKDHDAQMMTSISNLKHGSFYFVQDTSLLDEFFVDAFGGLISVVGKELKINVTLKSSKPFQDIKMYKTYGKMWEYNQNSYQITLPQLTQGSRKDFVFILELPKFIMKIKDNQRHQLIMEAKLQINDPSTNKTIFKQSNLFLTFFNHDEKIEQNEEDLEVQTQYYRVIVTEIIDQAQKACEQQQFQEAQDKIDQMILQIQKNQRLLSNCPQLIQDLNQAKQATEKYNFIKYGRGQMFQIISNNFSQQGVTSLFTVNGQQKQTNLRIFSYSNRVQTEMVDIIQTRKTLTL
ncbi:unnamed protein product [Paramecium sonneborni]|uniref:VWFA domain-containing protein n=1 Tax=Paramecium sonneborni TaxID=65129 RepID=A0A8S1RTX5_9CILI|nr:unnamed protein product [Paramecium sonneborni]